MIEVRVLESMMSHPQKHRAILLLHSTYWGIMNVIFVHSWLKPLVWQLCSSAELWRPTWWPRHWSMPACFRRTFCELPMDYHFVFLEETNATAFYEVTKGLLDLFADTWLTTMYPHSGIGAWYDKHRCWASMDTILWARLPQRIPKSW